MPNGRGVGGDVDAMIAQVRYDLTCDHMRSMIECDEQALRDLLSALAARLAEAGKDTERLEWLQRHGDDLTTDYETDSEGAARVNFSTRNIEEWPPSYYGESGYDLRSVIDAAMAEESDVHS